MKMQIKLIIINLKERGIEQELVKIKNNKRNLINMVANRKLDLQFKIRYSKPRMQMILVAKYKVK